jgi:hypothetical protein
MVEFYSNKLVDLSDRVPDSNMREVNVFEKKHGEIF